MALYLVTGIAGFIGSALAHELLERGERVRGIDNFSTGKAANVAGIRSRIELIEADLNDTAAAAEACRGADYVLHQAAIPSVPRSVVDDLAHVLHPGRPCLSEGGVHLARHFGVGKLLR